MDTNCKYFFDDTEGKPCRPCPKRYSCKRAAETMARREGYCVAWYRQLPESSNVPKQKVSKEWAAAEQANPFWATDLRETVCDETGLTHLKSCAFFKELSEQVGPGPSVFWQEKKKDYSKKDDFGVWSIERLAALLKDKDKELSTQNLRDMLNGRRPSYPPAPLYKDGPARMGRKEQIMRWWKEVCRIRKINNSNKGVNIGVCPRVALPDQLRWNVLAFAWRRVKRRHERPDFL